MIAFWNLHAIIALGVILINNMHMKNMGSIAHNIKIRFDALRMRMRPYKKYHRFALAAALLLVALLLLRFTFFVYPFSSVDDINTLRAYERAHNKDALFRIARLAKDKDIREMAFIKAIALADNTDTNTVKEIADIHPELLNLAAQFVRMAQKETRKEPTLRKQGPRLYELDLPEEQAYRYILTQIYQGAKGGAQRKIWTLPKKKDALMQAVKAPGLSFDKAVWKNGKIRFRAENRRAKIYTLRFKVRNKKGIQTWRVVIDLHKLRARFED